jgi:hypothetical protein
MKLYLSLLPEELKEGDFLDNSANNQNNFLLVFFTKENGELLLNEQKPLDFSNNDQETTVFISENGRYQLIIYSINNQVLSKITFNPSSQESFDILAIPYYLNIGKIELKDLLSNKKNEISLIALNQCNENNFCEENEKEFCPLDCPKVQNPNYPLSFQKPSANQIINNNDYLNNVNNEKEISNLKTATTSLPPPPQNYFYQILFITSIITIIILVVGILLIKKLKK